MLSHKCVSYIWVHVGCREGLKTDEMVFRVETVIAAIVSADWRGSVPIKKENSSRRIPREGKGFGGISQ